ncbi:MAG: MFS transporter [Verrucomicrobia bacterium]|nr:MFS transporter [Verrucomicrobiota bacterium]
MIADVAPSDTRRVVLAFAACNFLFSCASWMLVAFLPIYLRNDLGWSAGRIGMLIAAYIVTTLLLIVPLGYLSDRVSPKRLVQAGAALYIVYALLLTSVQTFGALVAAQIVGGMGEAVILIVLPALLYKDLGVTGRGQNVGAFVAGSMFGFSIGPMAAWALLDVAGLAYRGLFGMVCGVAVVLVLVSTLLKDAPPLSIHLADYLRDIKRREVLLVVIAIAGLGVHFAHERTTYALFLKNVAQFSRLGVAGMFGVIGIWMGVLSLLMGRIFDRNSHVLVLIGVGLALSGGFHAATPYVRGFGNLVVMRAIHTIGDVMVIFSYSVIVASIFPRARMGGNTGFALMFRAVGGVLGAAVAGLLDKEFTSLTPSFAFAGGAMIVCGAVLLINWRTFRRVSHGIRADLRGQPAPLPPAS